MKKDYTHIAVILDRSGSMDSIRDDVIGGFNAFLREQQATQGTATLSLVQFDTQAPYEVVHAFKLVQAVPPLTRETYAPRAGTPLYDAVGHGIKDLEQQIIAMHANNRPEFVVMVIVTDGMENSSREYAAPRVRAMMAEKQELAGWKFVFLSADIRAVNEALAQMGMRASHSMAFDKTATGSRDAFASISSNMAAMRRRERADVDFQEVDRRKHASEQARQKGQGK